LTLNLKTSSLNSATFQPKAKYGDESVQSPTPKPHTLNPKPYILKYTPFKLYPTF